MSKSKKNEEDLDPHYIIVDPNNTYIDPSVEIGEGCVIEPFSFLKGKTKIGDNTKIGPNSYIENMIVGSNCKIFYSTCLDSMIETEVKIGPYSRIRDNSFIGSGVYIGNYAEIKHSTIQEKSIISHFTYIGDATIGTNVNIGAGTVTCNYDGESKHNTSIGDNCFIGSGTMLIAPIKIGSKSITGAGSVVTKDVKANTTVAGNPARTLVN
tara:strand:+ start:186 stop:815 length:630 start_codon:yes stop_codon:yes gene_type:complete